MIVVACLCFALYYCYYFMYHPLFIYLLYYNPAGNKRAHCTIKPWDTGQCDQSKMMVLKNLWLTGVSHQLYNIIVHLWLVIIM